MVIPLTPPTPGIAAGGAIKLSSLLHTGKLLVVGIQNVTAYFAATFPPLIALKLLSVL